MDIDELILEIKKLTFDDKKRIIHTLKTEVMIQVNDWLNINKSYPCATVIFSSRHREHVDILGSVLNNPLSLAHPAVATAIKRWQQAIVYQSSIARYPERSSKAKWKPAQGNFYKIAENHLRRCFKRSWPALVKCRDELPTLS